MLKERSQKEREIEVGGTTLSKCSLAGPLPKLTLTVAATTSLMQRSLRICSFWEHNEEETGVARMETHEMQRFG